VAIVVIIVLIVIIALGVHSCQVSATNSALQDYTNSVSSLNEQSAANGKSLFTQLSQAAGSSNVTSVQNEINSVLSSEKKVYEKAQAASVPDQVRTGNNLFLQALKMRLDGTSGIADQIQHVLSSTATQADVNNLATQTAKFYASDVLYKSYALPQIYGALHSAGTRFSPINGDQSLPYVDWVLPSFIATQLHVSVPGAKSSKPAPGLHGHSLTSVSANGTTLSEGGTNTVAASPIPSFTFDFNNGGDNNEHNVKCKITINGTSVSGVGTVAETIKHQNATCTAKLNAAPPTGTQTVVATIEKVPGEANMSNNTKTYTITFQ
jgi:hypothetical protein